MITPLDAIDRALAPIIQRESGGNPYIGWTGVDLSGVPLTSTGFPDWPGRPGPAGNSTAAGLYQITRSTWDPIAAALGITDFSPESQRAVARQLYAERGLQPWGGSGLSDNVHATVAAEAAAANNGAAAVADALAIPGTTLADKIAASGGAGGLLGGPSADPSNPNNPNSALASQMHWLPDLMGTLYGLFQRFGIIIAAIVLMGLGAYAMLHKTTVIEAANSVRKS